MQPFPWFAAFVWLLRNRVWHQRWRLHHARFNRFQFLLFNSWFFFVIRMLSDLTLWTLIEFHWRELLYERLALLSPIILHCVTVSTYLHLLAGYFATLPIRWVELNEQAFVFRRWWTALFTLLLFFLCFLLRSPHYPQNGLGRCLVIPHPLRELVI